MLGQSSEASESNTTSQINRGDKKVYFCLHCGGDLVAEKNRQRETPPELALKGVSITSHLPGMAMAPDARGQRGSGISRKTHHAR